MKIANGLSVFVKNSWQTNKLANKYADELMVLFVSLSAHEPSTRQLVNSSTRKLAIYLTTSLSNSRCLLPSTVRRARSMM